MSHIQKDPLRELTQQEERALQKLAKATSERRDVVKRVNALLAVRAGKSYTEAAKVAGYKSNDTTHGLRNETRTRLKWLANMLHGCPAFVIGLPCLCNFLRDHS
jgi:hypothetical protein